MAFILTLVALGAREDLGQEKVCVVVERPKHNMTLRAVILATSVLGSCQMAASFPGL